MLRRTAQDPPFSLRRNREPHTTDPAPWAGHRRARADDPRAAGRAPRRRARRPPHRPSPGRRSQPCNRPTRPLRRPRSAAPAARPSRAARTIRAAPPMAPRAGSSRCSRSAGCSTRCWSTLSSTAVDRPSERRAPGRWSSRSNSTGVGRLRRRLRRPARTRSRSRRCRSTCGSAPAARSSPGRRRCSSAWPTTWAWPRAPRSATRARCPTGVARWTSARMAPLINDTVELDPRPRS